MRGLLRRWREWREAREEYRASMEEMQFHIEQETEHNIRNGMTPAAARSAAMRAFGGVDRFVEAAHDERPGTKWSDFRMSYLDWKLGARMLVKHPGVSLLGVVTLAAAIGIGAGWFEMTMMLFRPDLPLEDGDRIVRIEYWDVGTQDTDARTMHEFVQWRERLTTLEQLGAHRTVERNLVVPGAAPVLVQVAEVSPSAFDVTRVAPLLGRPLIAADEEPGGSDAVVIGYDAWQRHFDGDRGVVGREVQLGHVRATVVGVMPEGYRFPLSHQFWVPLRPASVQLMEGHAIEVFGRLRAGASMESARSEVSAWGARMAQESPATHAQLRLRLQPFAGSGEDSLPMEVFVINVAAWLILIAACANVAALMFARTAMRENEITVRNALGASRARVMGQLFTEALVLTSVAAFVGLVGAKLVIAYVLAMLRDRGNPVPFWWESGIEPVTVLYTGVLAVVGAAIVGLLPAMRATGRHMQARLAQIGSGGTSMRFGGAWSAIIVFQVAFSVVCLPFGIAAAFEARRETGLRAAYPADGFLTFRPVLDTEADPAVSPDANQVLAELARRVAMEPEVAGVTFTAALPGT
ncbi:MAG TPA: ABC transporter permease, partial [Longimicrobiales bacterium]|nr:ABC transporter permease [Longimicrobiales bacterium]